VGPRRDVNPWSALRAEFSMNENRRDGFPEPRTGGDRGDEAEGFTSTAWKHQAVNLGEMKRLKNQFKSDIVVPWNAKATAMRNTPPLDDEMNELPTDICWREIPKRWLKI
jgi:hypothetical protein